MPRASLSKNAGNSNLIPAIGYLRASSDKQDTSCEDQKRDIIRQTRQTHTIVAWYLDDGVSGWKDVADRRGFAQAIEHAKKGIDGAKTIVVWEQSRFSRFKKLRFMGYLNELDMAGARLYLLDHGAIDPENLPDVLLALLRADADYEYCKQLSRKVKRGMDALAEECYSLRGAPLGYEHSEPQKGESRGKLLLINEHKHEAGTVRLIFAMAIEGYTTVQIARELNQRNVPTYSILRNVRKIRGYKHLAKDDRPYVATKWSPQQVAGILRNPVYIGMYRWGRTCSSEFHKFDKVIFKEGKHDPIISEKDFRRAQKKLSARSLNKRQQHHGDDDRNVFSGLITCGLCGGAMHKTTGRRDTVVYRCMDHSGKCEGCRVRQSELLEMAIPAIVNYFQSDEIRERMTDRVMDTLRPADDRDAEQITEALEAAQADYKRVLRNIARAEDDELPLMRADKRELSTRIEELRAALANAERKPDDLDAEASEIVDEMLAAFEELETSLRDMDYPRVRRILGESVQGITVWAERDKSDAEKWYDRLPSGRDFTLAEMAGSGDPRAKKRASHFVYKLIEHGSIKIVKGRGGRAPGGGGSLPALYRKTKQRPPKKPGKAFNIVKGELMLRCQHTESLEGMQVHDRKVAGSVVIEFGPRKAA